MLALEVKGTLRPGGLPRFSRGALRQVSVEWLNDAKNPAMAEWELQAADLYGGVAVLDFARATWRVALTSDFETVTPVLRANDLLAPSRLPLPPSHLGTYTHCCQTKRRWNQRSSQLLAIAPFARRRAATRTEFRMIGQSLATSARAVSSAPSTRPLWR